MLGGYGYNGQKIVVEIDSLHFMAPNLKNRYRNTNCNLCLLVEALLSVMFSILDKCLINIVPKIGDLYFNFTIYMSDRKNIVKYTKSETLNLFLKPIF